MKEANTTTAAPAASAREARFILCRAWLPRSLGVFYVRETPGRGGKDWGYVRDPALAKPVSAYWARRFKRDCDYFNAIAIVREARP